MPLLAAPNFSNGRDPLTISRIRAALDRRGSVLDRHSDRDHNRTVFTIAGEPFVIEPALEDAAAVAIESIDMRRYRGLHPAVGAMDVCPVIWLTEDDRVRASERAMAVAETIARQAVPVFLYGDLATSGDRHERSFFRRGGLPELAKRMHTGELPPDLGPKLPHPSAGATLITARPPLAAFNIELDTPDAVIAQRIAGDLREAGGGLPGVRAIGLSLDSGRAQVSTNVHDPFTVPLGTIVERIRELAAALGAQPVEAELVGLVPEAALVNYPADVPIRGFNGDHDIIERRIDPPAETPAR